MLPEGRRYRPTHPNAPPSEGSRVALCLHIVSPAELAGNRISLDAELTLGRFPEPTVRSVLHPTVSRAHAALRFAPDGELALVDLGSSNGTWLNGTRVGAVPVALAPQAVLRLGDVLGVIDEECSAVFGEPGRRWRAYARSSPLRPPIRRACSCSEKPAAARSTWRARSTSAAAAGATTSR
jgi:pSer/pThr/pTyr-binding forkhead associated (FHA) protein